MTSMNMGGSRTVGSLKPPPTGSLHDFQPLGYRVLSTAVCTAYNLREGGALGICGLWELPETSALFIS